jgi:hypothetical protein
MNLQTPRFDEQLAEKLGCKITEGVGLFVWAKLPEVYLQKSLLIRFYKEVYFYSTELSLEVTERDISDLHYVKEEKVQEAMSI